MATGQLGLEATIVGPSGPAGANTIIVSEGGTPLDTDISTVDFDATDFNLVESPENTVTVALAYGTGVGTPAEGNHTHTPDHAAVTVVDSASIDMTLTGQQISAAAIFGTSATTVAEGNHTHTNDHVPVTVSDTASIDLTLTGQQISAAAIFGTTSTTVAQGNHTHTGTYAPLASPTFTGTVTLPVGLTGVIRTDTGVVSVDSDVTDIVTAASTTVAGKVELATDAETNTGTDTARAITPSNLEAWTGSAFITTVGTLASPVLTTPTISATGFTNANHAHTAANSGGTLDAAAISSGLLANGRIATGTPTGSKFLRDDQVWTVPTAAATPGGSDTQVQFNDGGGMGGDAGLTYDKTANKLTILAGSFNTAIDAASDGGAIDARAFRNSAAASDGNVFINVYGKAGGVTEIYANSTVSHLRANGLVTAINNDGVDLDTQIKGDTDANLVFVDASTDRVGIGTASPAVKLDVTGEARVSTAGTNAASVVTVGGTQTLTAKTLTTPTIVATGFSNMNHTHLGATTGGLLTPASIGADADLATFSLPASTTISTFGASLVDDADAAAALTTLTIYDPIVARFMLAGDGGTISTINNFFGATSAFSTAATTRYFIEAHLYFLNSTAGTVTFTLTSSVNIIGARGHYRGTPAAGGTASATSSVNAQLANPGAATAIVFPVTSSLTDAVEHSYQIYAVVETNGAGNIRINATKGVGGTITPRKWSFYRVWKLDSGNVGSFVA
jgi:hypothetical protein